VFAAAVLVIIGVAGVIAATLHRPSVFDVAFEVMGLESLSECPNFEDQQEVFLLNRVRHVPANDDVESLLTENWNRFLASDRGEAPSSCEWEVIDYPAGFIVGTTHTLIVINPSDVVIGAPLPEGATGDLVMDARRYSTTSLGGFRGAATIPPRSLFVIALRQ
jgi:hypothetical protein